MNTNDFDRTARLWLELGPTAISDRALQAALDEIHVTRQRRAWWPARRISTMTNTLRIAAGVAAIALVAALGVSLLPAGGIGRGPVPSPTPTATPSPTPIALIYTSTDVPGPGTFVTGDPFLARVTFTVPAGWDVGMGGPYAAGASRRDTGGSVDLSIFDKVSADPCDSTKGFLAPPPGPTVADLASALAEMPGVTVSTPTDVTFAGYQGKHLTITAPASFTGCTFGLTDGAFLIWELPMGATFTMTESQVQQIWILDVDGIRLVIDTPELPGQSATEKAEVEAILDSIQIAPSPAASDMPAPSRGR